MLQSGHQRIHGDFSNTSRTSRAPKVHIDVEDRWLARVQRHIADICDKKWIKDRYCRHLQRTPFRQEGSRHSWRQRYFQQHSDCVRLFLAFRRCLCDCLGPALNEDLGCCGEGTAGPPRGSTSCPASPRTCSQSPATHAVLTGLEAGRTG